ncbi:MAG: hypothetical protein GXY67_07950 [Clostridiales bacterium]|nr:hypothetical protein [Clostridiales bacterium]
MKVKLRTGETAEVNASYGARLIEQGEARLLPQEKRSIRPAEAKPAEAKPAEPKRREKETAEKPAGETH